MNIERRHTWTPAHLETRQGQPPKIVGYASVFWSGKEETQFRLGPNLVERVMPGAFKNALARPDDVRGLFNHDPNLLLGRTSAGTMKLSTDHVGLKYEIETGDTSVARDVIEHLRRRDVTGSSFAFTIDAENWRTEKAKDGVLEIREIVDTTLFDVSPVTFPAYAATDSSVRTANADAVAQAMQAREQAIQAQHDWVRTIIATLTPSR